MRRSASRCWLAKGRPCHGGCVHSLAGELHRAKGDCADAIRRYQDLFGPFVLNKQKAALRFADSFAPKSKFALFLRNQIFNLMAHRWVANLSLGSGLSDKT